MEIRICKVYYEDQLAGLLMKTPKGSFLFGYIANYLALGNAQPLSFSLPLQGEPFHSDKLFPFFEGLLSEGWLKKIQSKNQKIDERDSFSLLEENGQDLIGAVKIIPITEMPNG